MTVHCLSDMDIRELKFQIKRKGRTVDVFWPCENCYDRNRCEFSKGCNRWRTWFRAVWSELRRRYA